VGLGEILASVPPQRLRFLVCSPSVAYVVSSRTMANDTAKRLALKHLGHDWEQITSQLSGRERQAALAVWHWASIRFSSLGTKQDRYFKRYGAAATYQRINRVRAWLDLELV
jgi:hypothetical protein